MTIGTLVFTGVYPLKVPGPMSSPALLRWKLAFWILLPVVIVASLLPDTSSLPTTGWDKSNHMLEYLTLSFLGIRAYPSQTGKVLLGLFLYGGLIEVLQSFMPYRMADYADMMANSLGLLAGWAMNVMLAKRASAKMDA